MSTSEPAPQGAPSLPSLAAQLMDQLWGYQRTQMLFAAAELGLADHLADGPQPVEMLAAATGAHAPSLYRLLRALAGQGIFTELPDGRFALTPLAALLCSDTPGSLRAMVLAEAGDLYPVWGQLLYSVRTGEPAFEQVYGMPNWEYRRRHPEANARFNAYMGDFTRQKAAAVVAHYRFPSSGTLVDVGGGDGTLLAAILQQQPGLRGVLVDLPHVLPAAEPVLAAAGVTDRCQLVGGDFFTEVPAGGDCYVLSTVLHDWDDERGAAILRSCHRAMGPGGLLVVVERVMPAGNTPSVAKLRDLHMLVTNAGGRERTEAEWRALLVAGGFRLTASTPTGPAYHTIQAVPV